MNMFRSTETDIEPSCKSARATILGSTSWAAQIVLFFLWNEGVDDGVEGYDKNPGQEEWSVCRPALHNESCRVSRELAAPLYTLNWLSFRTKPGLLRRLRDEEKADSWNLDGIG